MIFQDLLKWMLTIIIYCMFCFSFQRPTSDGLTSLMCIWDVTQAHAQSCSTVASDTDSYNGSGTL